MSENEKIEVMLVVVFTIFLALMGIFFFVLINKYRISLEKKQMTALKNLILGQDNERERLSRDLHDQMGPQLSAIAAMVSVIKSDKPEVNELLSEVKDELWKASQEVRNISHDLMSTSLKKYGLMEAIRKLILRTNEPGLLIEFESDSESYELDGQQISHFYSIVRELIYNTIKHAGASLVKIKFQSNPSAGILEFHYSDNGKGNAANDSLKTGIGISNIQTRVKLMGGTMELNMINGFNISIRIQVK